ncbi:MAG TPA: hypothetical protein VEP90_23910 [Methylomirabilota bacterium]|nr:hypothetical protein [Methylomirabilota bacterium]
MQLEPGNFRYRGWRESKRLVEIIHSVPADLKSTTAQVQVLENNYVITQGLIDVLSQQVVSQLQHARSQIFYRLKKDFG